MRNNYSNWLLILMVCASGALTAQVSFTNMNFELQNISGSSVEDCAVDMDGDNLDDIVRVTNAGIYIDYQQADGSFVGVFHSMNIQNLPNWSICAADIDRNGYTDLLFGNGSRVSFCFANDDGTGFVEDAHPEYIFSQRSTFSDIDNDGNLDAFVCHDVDQSHPYRNDGTGNMILDQSLIETLDVGGNYAAIWCDYDNDSDCDLYITKCRGGAAVGDPQRINLMYRNNGDGTFSEVGEEINMNDGDQSWTTVFEDFDNDGDFDAFTVNHAWANRFMENNGDGTFTDIIGTTGINAGDLGAWNCDAGDFDNNGYVDIFSEMQDELYLNNGDGTFTAQSLNFDSGGIGDFNNDGFLDVINGNNMWVNNGNDNNYIQFNLEGIVSNKDAIGARVEIYGDFGMQVREVRAGESFSPMSSMTVHFGLGTHDAVDEVIIKWPSGIITTVEDVAINTQHNYIEAECLLDPNEIAVNGALEICPGETVELMADMGYEYTWSTGETTQSITVSEEGNYSVVLWDGDCASISNTVFVDIIETETPTITLEGEGVFCEGGEAILTSSIGSDYEWSDGQEGQSIIVHESGEYFVTVSGLCNDIDLSSESIEIIVLDTPDEPVAADVTLPEPNVAMLEATGENVLWYDAEDATEPVGSGPTYTTEFVDNSVTYWASSHIIHGGELENGGKEDNSGGGGLPSVGAYSYFDVYETFTLLNVRVYVPDNAGDGVRTVQLFDNLGAMLQEAEFDLTVGEHVIDLNWEIIPGAGYSLRCEENNLFRNNSGVSYPYPIGTVGAITDSFYGGSYYYYFYDWNVQLDNQMCESPRVPVTASVVGIDEIEQLDGVELFPNPGNGNFTLTLEMNAAANVSLNVFDIAGKQVHTQQTALGNGTTNLALALEHLATGVYQLQIEIEGQRHALRMVIQ